MFNYNHLYYFYTTARLGGVTRASRALKIAQPSLSIQLKTLEKQLGLSLFIKVGRRLNLSPDGERVYGLCQKMFEAAEELDWYLKNSSKNSPGQFRIGVAPEIERPFIADVLSNIIHLNKADDRPLLTMVTDEHAELMNQLSHGELDVVVTNNRSHAANVTMLTELKMPVLAVINPKRLKLSQDQKNKTFSLKDVKGSKLNLVLPSEKLKLRIESDIYLQKNKFQNPIALQSDILSVIVRAVLEGVGVGFLPRHYIENDLRAQRLVSLTPNPLWFTRLYVYSRNSKVVSPVIPQIKSFFKKLAVE